MKGLIPFVVVIGLLGAGGAFMFTQLSADLDEAQFYEKLHAQQTEFVEHAALTRLVPDEKLKFDRAQLIKWNIKEVNKIYKEHPKQKMEDRFLVELERKAAKKKNKNLAKQEQFKERYEWLKGVWEDTVSRGDYDTVLTQEKEGVRVEVTAIEKWVPPDGGKQQLRMDLLLWGPVHDHISFRGLSFQIIRNMEQDNGRTKKVLAKLEGGGPPNVLHPSGPNPAPEEWIPEWPAGVAAGYYAGLPLLPSDAEKLSFTMSTEIRTLGGTSVPIEFEWEGIDVDDAWKGTDNTMWDANVAEATEEELAAAGIK